ncbi:MAG: hypothetical protein KJI71_00090 [Patescibacteria group bacterium]|nr:hypothetical protein [Patescibacteria group bacterium]
MINLDILENLKAIKQRILALLITNDFITDSSSIEDERSMNWNFYQENKEFIDIIDGILENMKVLIIPSVENKSQILKIINWIQNTNYDNISLEEIQDYLEERTIDKLELENRFQ